MQNLQSDLQTTSVGFQLATRLLVNHS